MGLWYRPARLGIDSWAPEKVYNYGLRAHSLLKKEKTSLVSQNCLQVTEQEGGALVSLDEYAHKNQRDTCALDIEGLLLVFQ
jgi:hypothetical protein